MKKNNQNLFGIEANSFDNRNIKGKYKKSWIEDSLFFEESKGKQVASPQSFNYVGTSFTNKKINIFFIFLLVFFLLLISRFFYLQIIKRSSYRVSAENNRQRIISIPSERGLIFDRQGIQLTKNIPNFSLAIIPQDLPRKKEQRIPIINKLAILINKSEEELSNILDEYGSYSYESVVIQENLDYDTALNIIIQTSELPGIEILRGSKRLYLDDFGNEFNTSTNHSLSHILGYIGKLNKEEFMEKRTKGYLSSDNIGKIGLEKTYESFLRGVYGKKRIEVDSLGKEQNILAQEAPEAGFHLEMSIDSKIQNKLEEIVNHYLKTNNKKRAAAVALDPRNGEVLAMVSLPAFDNNDFSGGIAFTKYQKYLNNEDQPLFNRAVSGLYPSGSVIKTAFAAAALEEKIINSKTSFLSNGGLRVSQWFFPDWQVGGHGVTNVRRALAWSVNTFFYYIGGGYNDFVGLGVEKMIDYLQEFGFGNKTNIDTTGEKIGFLPSKEWKEKVKGERWYIGDTYNLSIGQGDLLVTPLQIANMTAVFTNGGKLYQPHIVKSIINPITEEKTNIPVEILNENFISSVNLNIVKLGMKDCVDYGSCRRLSLLPFSTGGKTGTAQWNKNKANHAWFTSFAPYDNPEIVLTVLVEEGEEGSAISVPIAYDFYQWWWSYKNEL